MNHPLTIRPSIPIGVYPGDHHLCSRETCGYTQGRNVCELFRATLTPTNYFDELGNRLLTRDPRCQKAEGDDRQTFTPDHEGTFVISQDFKGRTPDEIAKAFAEDIDSLCKKLASNPGDAKPMTEMIGRYGHKTVRRLIEMIAKHYRKDEDLSTDALVSLCRIAYGPIPDSVLRSAAGPIPNMLGISKPRKKSRKK